MRQSSTRIQIGGQPYRDFSPRLRARGRDSAPLGRASTGCQVWGFPRNIVQCGKVRPGFRSEDNPTATLARDFVQEGGIQRLWDVLQLVAKFGVSPETLFNAAKFDPDSDRRTTPPRL